jgi:hypothetical protein
MTTNCTTGKRIVAGGGMLRQVATDTPAQTPTARAAARAGIPLEAEANHF